MSDFAGDKVPGGTEIQPDEKARQRYTDLKAEAQAGEQPRGEDIRIWLKCPPGFPLYKWMAFSSAVQAEVVKLAGKHGVIPNGGG